MLNNNSIRHFKNLLKSLKHYVEYYNIHLTDSGLEINSMNQRKISFIQIKVGHDYFDTFTRNDLSMIGIPAETFSKCLRCCPKTKELHLEIYEHDPDTLQIHMKSKRRSVRVKMSLLELDTESLEIPTIEYDSVIEMPVQTLLSTIHDFELLECEKIILETYYCLLYTSPSPRD